MASLLLMVRDNQLLRSSFLDCAVHGCAAVCMLFMDVRMHVFVHMSLLQSSFLDCAVRGCAAVCMYYVLCMYVCIYAP